MDKKRGHHVVLAEGPEEPLAGLGVVVGHAEHVAWGAGSASVSYLPCPRAENAICFHKSGAINKILARCNAMMYEMLGKTTQISRSLRATQG